MLEIVKKIPGLRSRIGRKLMLYILFFSSIITFLGTGIQLFLDLDHDIRSVHRTIAQIESSYLSSITNSLWVTDNEFLRIQLNGILELPDMQYIEVRKDKKVLDAVGTTQSETVIKETYPLVYSYNGQNIILGELYIVASLKNIYARIFDRILLILTIQTIKTFLVSIFIFSIFYQLVGRHIISMASFMESLQEESMNKPLLLDQKAMSERPDEIDQLAESFNRMQSSLNKSFIALQESEKKYLTLFNTSPIGLALCKINGELVDVNLAYANIIGYSIEETLNLAYWDITPQKYTEQEHEQLESLATNKRYGPYEKEYIHKDGHLVPVRLIGLQIEQNGEKMIWSSVEDITDQKRMITQLQQAQKMESIGTLAGGIAHDFNNILYPIIGFAEMLKDDLPLNSPEHENAQEIFHAGQRGGELVKQILAFSRQADHKLRPIRVQKILKEVLKLTRSSIPIDIEIQQEIQQDCGSVMAESTQLHQIGMNLITNAYHAVEKTAGKISVQLKETMVDADDLQDSALQPGQYAMLSVSDNGIGIGRNVINNIFEPYFTTKDQGKGTGLGLAVVYGIVKESKGDIKVFSEEGKGTRFDVYLPLFKESTEALMNDHVSVPQKGTESLLLVDDEISVVRLEKQMLERLGYKVETQSSSIEALESFKANPDDYDLVVTDMTMPNMTGDHLAKEILSIKPDMSIIICTGFSERINKQHAERIGVKGFLMKPIVKSDMAQMVREVLDGTQIS